MKLHDTCTTDQAAPQFDHEWQRRAFGLALALSEFRHYPWSEFQQTLIETIGQWESTPESTRGQWEYYDHWVATLETLVDRHELLTAPVHTDDGNHAVGHDH
ncbi:nitrile hydratase accessory protein [Mycolicibacterium sp. 3033]|nr:nitrile hydratase accessory protein [Mycolicibacterium aurantiacum]